MLSVAEDTYLTISTQAKKRGISIQELLRAVIVPEWVRQNLQHRSRQMPITEISPEPIAPQMNSYHRNRILENTVGQLKY
jgi:hypothetical protein